jgi:hypothetical protein
VTVCCYDAGAVEDTCTRSMYVVKTSAILAKENFQHQHFEKKIFNVSTFFMIINYNHQPHVHKTKNIVS